MQPMIDRHVSEVIDGILSGDGTFDVGHHLVSPILAGITAEHLGLEIDDPVEFFENIQKWGPADKEVFDQAWRHIAEAVVKRRDERRDDVVSHLVQLRNPEFTNAEIEQMTYNVILGAHHTTMGLSAQTFIYLDTHPDVRRELTANPEKIRAAVEEFLRLFVVALGVSRTVTREVEIDGVTLKVGDRVMLALGAANHDPAKYPNPAEFDLERGSAQQVGMGYGTHFCLGSHLAKSIMAATILAVLRRLPDYRVDHENIVRTDIIDFAAVPAIVSARSGE